MTGYNIYVLDVDDESVVVGNDEYLIEIEIPLSEEIVNTQTWGEITLKQLYCNLMNEKKVIGSRAYEINPTTIGETEKKGLVMDIVISPEGELDRHSILITIANNDGEWNVVDAELSVVCYD